MPAKICFTKDQIDNIVKLYADGLGPVEIGKIIGVSCSPVIRVLRENGVTIRSGSDAMFIRMAKATPEERLALSAAAHEAVRGRKADHAELIRRAKAHEGIINASSHWEHLVRDLLVEAGLDFIPGKAVDRYNLDFAIGSVAVEVFGGGWACTDRRRIDRYVHRTKQIGELGYHVIFLMMDRNGAIITANQLAAEIQFASRHPTDSSQYWVIWGDRKSTTGLCSQIDHDAFVRPFKNIRDTTTGRYHSVAK